MSTKKGRANWGAPRTGLWSRIPGKVFALHNLWVEGRDLELDLGYRRNRSDI